MNNTIETGWLDATEKPMPERVGYYKRLYAPNMELFSWWDGELFSVGYYNRYERPRYLLSASQNLPWKGVA